MHELTLDQRRKIRSHVMGETSGECIWFGRYATTGYGYVNASTPIVLVDGKQGPTVEGHPYCKTNFVGKGGFSKTLYTSSTFRIEVGKDWVKENA